MRDRKFLLPYIFLLISILGWIVGISISVLKSNSESIQINKEKFEDVIHRNQKVLRENISLIIKGFEEGTALPVIMDSLAKKETSYFVYDKDTLIFWSDASIPVVEERDSLIAHKVVQLKNGWFLVEKKHYKGLDFLGLFKIKQQYLYENEFLKNRFNNQFELTISPDIQRDVPGKGIAIYDDGRHYLFSLFIKQVPFISSLPSRIGLFFILIAIIGTILFTGSFLKILSRKIGNYAFLFAGIILFFIYYWFIRFNILYLMREGEIFSPVLFAYSSWLPSLVSMLLLALLLHIFFFWFYRLFRFPSGILKYKNNSKVMIAIFAVAIAVVFFYFLFVNRLIVILVQHSSTLSLYYRITELDVVAITKVTIIGLLLFSSLFLLEKVLRMFYLLLPFKYQLVIIGVVPVFVYLIFGIFNCSCLPESFVFFFLIGLLLLFFIKRNRVIHSYEVFTWIIFIFSFYVTIVLIRLYPEKEKKSREVLIENLSFRLVREEDPVAEMYLKGIESVIQNDENIIELLRGEEFSPDDIKKYIEKKYFVGYLSRYELQVVPCWEGGDLVIEETGETFNCYNYFDELISEIGDNVYASRHFYFLDNDNGSVTYMGLFNYFKENLQNRVNLYIEINSKPVFVGLGYPELLKSEKEQMVFEVAQEYSYAKYVNGHLAKQFGDYEYDISSDFFERDEGQKYYVKSNNESHLVYGPEDNVLIVLSRPTLSVASIIIGFSIFFIAFFLLALLFLIIIKIKNGIPFFRLTIRERIQLALVSIVLVLLLIVGTSSIYYSIYQFKNKNSEILEQRIKSVLMEVEHKLGKEDRVTYEMHDYIQPLLQKFSNVFFCDINLFSLDGHLLGTSRPELYVNGLTGCLMSPKAFYELSFNKKLEFIHEESIGTLKYVSAYVMVLNDNNIPLAYLNIPYFVGSDELRKQVSSLIVGVINAYLIFVLLAISFAVFVAKRITYPLSMMQNRLGKVSLSKKNEKIEYRRKDEIGELVTVYNRMVDELAESVGKLAQSEREMAWREMAKQIAHEIKNPLTPMRLNVQYLQRARKDKVEDFDGYLEKVTSSLIEQIDQLSVIATEFSNFAKMPVAKRTRIDLISKLKQACDLFRETPVIEIIEDFDATKPVWVYADSDQMVSVFNNIINNASQSIPKAWKGILNIKVETDETKVKITFADNGTGMSEEVKEKIFQPNFTTKSSGMGLGLAIVKNIITNSKGKIWFTTKHGEGTTFFIELPLYSR